MKIELISNNQIKCVLTKKELASRKIKPSELAYGTTEAQELFQDMMQQANEEFGFDANNVPLMIEAVPLSSGSIMLIITKVSDEEDTTNKLNSLPLIKTKTFKKRELNIDVKTDVPEPEVIKNFFLSFRFNCMDNISKAVSKISDYKINASKLYKDTITSAYYLTMTINDVSDNESHLIKGIMSEYGEDTDSNIGITSYYKEHYKPIIIENAVEVMQLMNN